MHHEQPQPNQRAEDSEKPKVDLEKEPMLPLPELEDQRIETYIHEHREASFDGAREQVLEVIKIVKEDEQALQLINETLKSLFHYVETIYYLEVNVKMLMLRFEGEEFKEKAERHDSRRRRAHDALISNLISTTRYLNANFPGKVPQTGIYNGNPEDLTGLNRVAIGDWAIELEHEILLSRGK